MAKFEPKQIEYVAESRDRYEKQQAADRATASGLTGAARDRSIARALAAFQAKPLVTAIGYRDRNDPDVHARFWARVPIGDNYWRVNGKLATGKQGRIVVRTITVEPWPGSRAEPSSSILRRLPVPHLRELALAQLVERGEFLSWAKRAERLQPTFQLLSTPGRRRQTRQAANFASTNRPQRGRPSGQANQAFYSKFARRAITLAADPTLAQPLYQALAAELGSKPETVRKWIATARRLRLLDPRPNVWQPGAALKP